MFSSHQTSFFLFNLRRLQTLTPVSNTPAPISEIKDTKVWLQTGAVFSLGLNRKIGERYSITTEILGKVYDFRDFESYYGVNLGVGIFL